MNIIYKFIFFTSVFFIFAIYDFNFFNPVDFSFFVLLIINSNLLFGYSHQPISIFRNIQLFFSFFLILAPFIQYKESVVFWGNVSFSKYDYLICNIVLIFIFSLYATFYYYLRNKFYLYKFNNGFSKFNFNKINTFSLILLYFISIICFFITFSNNGYSIMSLMFRGGEFSQMSSNITGPLWLLSQYFVRPLPMIAFLAYYVVVKKINIHFTLLCLIGIITAFPLGMARFSVAALYIPFVIILFPILQRKFNFTLTIIISLLFLFPFLDTFRRFTSETEIKFEMDFGMFQEGHFDSYQSILSVLKHDLITYGHQLLGVIFFWVPRSLWPNKPIGSGAFSANEVDLDFSNISMNFFAEGYINFGFFGVCLFTIGLAYFSAYFDVKFVKQNFKSNLYSLWYYIVVGFMFFILRGDMLSSTAYFIGFSLGYLLVFKIISK